MDKNKGINKALSKSYFNYLKFGERSPEKLKPLHGYIASCLEEELDDNRYLIYAKGYDKNNTEKKCKGKYYDKDVDITVDYKGTEVLGIEVKFVTSNYKQNSNNYFVSMLGETANVKRQGLSLAQIVFIRKELPYFKKDGKKIIKNVEVINDHNLNKYSKLNLDKADNLYHKPDFLYLKLLDINDSEILNNYVINGDISIKKKTDYFEKIIREKKYYVKIIEDNSIFNANNQNLLEKENMNFFPEFIKVLSHQIKANIAKV